MRLQLRWYMIAWVGFSWWASKRWRDIGYDWSGVYETRLPLPYATATAPGSAGRSVRIAQLLLEPGGRLARYLPVRLHASRLSSGYHHRCDGGGGRVFRRAARSRLRQPHACQHWFC